jgi:hypothetical protein
MGREGGCPDDGACPYRSESFGGHVGSEPEMAAEAVWVETRGTAGGGGKGRVDHR